MDPEVRVLLVSGYSQEGQVQAIPDRGYLDFLRKPFGLGEPSRKVTAVLPPGTLPGAAHVRSE